MSALGHNLFPDMGADLLLQTAARLRDEAQMLEQLAEHLHDLNKRQASAESTRRHRKNRLADAIETGRRLTTGETTAEAEGLSNELAEWYRGQYQRSQRAERNADMAVLARYGITQTALADTFNLSERQVRNILKAG